MNEQIENDLSRPSVQVTLPAVKLQLKDLSFLRSLAQPRAVRCHPQSGVLDRLRFLDLVARAKVLPSQAVRDEVHGNIAKLKADLKNATKNEEWSRVASIAYEIRRAKERLEPSEDDVLTEKGKALLRKGEVSVRVRKVGCAK